MPGYKSLFKNLEGDLIRDCPLIVDDDEQCLNVYEKEIANLKGSNIRKKSFKTQRMDMLHFPKTLVETYISDMLSMDHLFVQGIPLLPKY